LDLKKNILYCILLVCIFFAALPDNAVAQKRPHIQNLPKYDLKPYHFGFALCINKMNFDIKPVESFQSFDSLFVIQSTPQWGFNIGIVSNLRLFNYADLRFLPTLSFGQRILDYTLKTSTTTIQTKKIIPSTFLDFPLLLKYKSKRLNNFRAYVITGVQYSLDLESQAKKKAKNNDVVKLKDNDYLYEFGVGFDFYTEFFKFSTELKMMYGLRDMLKRDGTVYTNSIDRLKSKMFQLSFLFE
jgi:hypothetical protein